MHDDELTQERPNATPYKSVCDSRGTKSQNINEMKWRKKHTTSDRPTDNELHKECKVKKQKKTTTTTEETGTKKEGRKRDLVNERKRQKSNAAKTKKKKKKSAIAHYWKPKQ